MSNALVLYVHKWKIAEGIMGEMNGYRPAEALIGESTGIRRVGEQLRKAALTDIPVLIVGESGTGKELAARLLHDLSARRAHNFLKVNCPTVLSKQFESELFGHEPGAFPGANEAKAGKCEKADKGTLFLNEIGELDLTLQPKLLHALQDFRVARIGASTERTVDIRAICTTSQDLEAQVAKGDFRADLLYRINVLTINLPPLRERLSDVPILMNHFIRVHSGRIGGRPQPMSMSLTKSLECYHWPGNVRELENLAKCYVVLGGEEQVISMLRRPDDLHVESLDPIDTTTPLRIQTKRAVQHLERRIILSVLQSHQWNRRKTARSLDISYRTLLSKIKDSSIPPVYREQTAASLASRA